LTQFLKLAVARRPRLFGRASFREMVVA